MCKRFLEEWSFALKYVPDKCNTQEMSNKAIEKEHLLQEFVPDEYRPQWMYEKADGRELDFCIIFVLEFVPDHL